MTSEQGAIPRPGGYSHSEEFHKHQHRITGCLPAQDSAVPIVVPESPECQVENYASPAARIILSVKFQPRISQKVN
jgi:hypothetical protein